MGKGERVIDLNAIKQGKINSIEWVDVKYNKDGLAMPTKCWENLEVLLKKHNIHLRLNDVTHEVDFIGLNGAKSRNGRLTDIYSLQTREGLGLSRNETVESINRIAEQNKYNPFTKMLLENINDNDGLIEEVFSCLPISYEYLVNEDFFRNLFFKWCVNVVAMSFNSLELEKPLRSQGVLILQGKQGVRKSTFFEKLMPNREWFKGDMSINPEKVDSIIQNTRYVLVEWGEIDNSFKSDQAKLKQFITASDDEYRMPYSILSERHARKTSYCGSVNKLDFLKDETGSRRFWVIPVGDTTDPTKVNKIDIDKLEKIDMAKFWGAVYYCYKNELVKTYLDDEDQRILAHINTNFNYETDITIILNDRIEWDMPTEQWEIYTISTIADYLDMNNNSKQLKQLKQELEKKGCVYKSYRTRTGTVKKGFRIPRITVTYNHNGN